MRVKRWVCLSCLKELTFKIGANIRAIIECKDCKLHMQPVIAKAQLERATAVGGMPVEDASPARGILVSNPPIMLLSCVGCGTERGGSEVTFECYQGVCWFCRKQASLYVFDVVVSI